MGRSGIVALVGRPNVGKSTLMNQLVGDKVSIITPMAQTTRNQIRGIQNLPDGQIVYLDTPGIHRPRKELNRYMVDVALHSLEGVDIVLFLVDASRPDQVVTGMEPEEPSQRAPGYGEDMLIMEHLRSLSVPCFLVFNKVDRLHKKIELLPLMEAYKAHGNFAEIVPISALDGDGLDILTNEMVALLPEGPGLFPPEYATDRAERFLVAEMIREKVILCTRDEIPHSCAVVVDMFDESERTDETEKHGLIHIEASVFVERNSQKGIVIGKKGSRLKEIGTLARQDIEQLLGCKVFLRLWVKVEKNWSQSPHGLRRLGYRELS